MTSTQLRLITPQPEWKLDAETRRIGFEGIAKARETLRRQAAERIAAERSVPEHSVPEHSVPESDTHDLAA